MSFNHKNNSMDIFNRNVLVGLINLLNNKIVYENVIDDENIDSIYIPWFPTQYIDERFLQDYFTNWSDCINPNIALTNYDSIPRGIVLLNSASIQSGNLTNRFVNLNYIKELNGNLETFSSFVKLIPLELSFSCKVLLPSYTDSLKIFDAIINTFYNVQTFNILYKGLKIPCQVTFPESYNTNKSFEFSYSSEMNYENIIQVTFDLSLETYFPSFEKEGELHFSNKIHNFNVNINLDGESLEQIKNNINFNIEGIYTYINDKLTKIDKFFNNQNILIKYKCNYNLNNLMLRYSLDNNNFIKIDNINSNGIYIFNYNNESDNIIYEFSNDVVKPAKLKIIVNENGEIDEIIILYGGYGYNKNTKLYIYEKNNYNIVEGEYDVIVLNNRIAKINILNKGKNFTPTKKYNNFNFNIVDTNNIINVKYNIPLYV